MRFIILVLALMIVNLQAWSARKQPISETPEINRGVVVEGVAHQSEAEKAGVWEGDIVLAWSRGSEHGDIQSPFDLFEIETEQSPRGNVTLHGLRGAEAKSWAPGPDSWGIQVRPVLADTSLAVYLEGRELANTEKLPQAEARWRALANQDQNSNPKWLRPWLLLRVAEMNAKSQKWSESDQAYQESLQSSASAGAEVQRQVARRWARTFEQRSIWPEAEKYYLRADGEESVSAESLSRAGDLDSVARVASRRGDLAKAADFYVRSLNIRHKLAPDSIVVGASLSNLGNLETHRGDLDKAESYYRQALAILEKIAPGSLRVATTFVGLGNVAFDRGDLAKAGNYYDLALQIKQRLVPVSLDVAAILNDLGNVAYSRGELSPAGEYYRRALDIKQKIAPGSLSVASTLANLGNVAHDRGDLGQAEDYYRQDLEITEKLAPGSLDFAGSLMDLGIISQRRGNLVRAEEYYLQALEIKKKLAPASLDLAYTLNNLGSVAQDRGDLVRAEDYYRQTLVIRKRLAPGSLSVADALSNLAEIALESDDLTQAEDYDRQALEIKEKIAPGTLDIAMSLENLGGVAERRGDLVKAEEYLQRALALRESIAPLNVATADGLNRLGVVAKERGDLEHAEQYCRRALNIWEKVAPESASEAESLAGLAFVMRRRGQPDEAKQFYERALRALEGQTAQLGGSDEVRAGFRARYESLYREYADLLMTQGKVNEAFRVVELSRARTLLETLAAAHVNLRKDVDVKLVTKERSLQADLKAKSDRRIQLLSSEHSEDEITTVEKEIGDLITECQDIEAQIRFSSPAYAAIAQPLPLSAEQIQEELIGPDTLLLEYSLGEEHSYVFAISAHSVQAHEIGKRSRIERLAMRLYSLLNARNIWSREETEQRRRSRVTDADSEYVRVAAELSHILLGPLESQLAHHRLLIVGDGALLHVPFAVLPEPASSKVKASVPLMVKHEIANLPSASVLAALRRQRSGRRQPLKEAVILADPVFNREDGRVAGKLLEKPVSQVEKPTVDNAQSNDRLVRSAQDADLLSGGQLQLARLPFSRREADGISGVIPAGKVKMALGFEASRNFAVSGELSQYRIVHFATHALVNDRHPDLSGLVLSLVDQHGQSQPGFLDLRDIYNMDLDADLVVLSACDTALGKQIEGEGMIGLTRGFMYAGAQGVVGTLWKVEDFATAKFMMAFYRAMEQNHMLPAQALRRAELALWKEKHWSSPYYWAAFSLQGDWK